MKRVGDLGRGGRIIARSLQNPIRGGNMSWQETVMSKDSIEEVKYLEIRENPEYHDLRLQEKCDVEEGAIARAQAKATWKALQKEVDEAEQRGIRKGRQEAFNNVSAYITSLFEQRAFSEYHVLFDSLQAFLKECKNE